MVNVRARKLPLKRGIFRMSMDPRNLYLLSKLAIPDLEGKSLFQRKWLAKRETRKYHGHFLPERVFDSIFDGKLRGVVGKDSSQVYRIPLASQTYANMERRLDIVIYRSLFATSPLQAGNIIRHGRVKLNGETFTNPAYLLKPGDLFLVDSKTVLRNLQIEKKQKNNRTLCPASYKRPSEKSIRDAQSRTVTGELKGYLPSKTQITQPELLGGDIEIPGLGFQIDDELEWIRITQEHDPHHSSPKTVYYLLDPIDVNQRDKKNRPKKFAFDYSDTAVKNVNSQVKRTENRDLDSLDSLQLPDLHLDILPDHDSTAFDDTSSPWRSEIEAEAAVKIKYRPEIELRPYLSAFAFIPTYLEVSHDVCAAVYLRHPVARPGETEVPSPYPPHLHALAYNYYIRKRK
ncbi:37S ribosomal protein S4-like, mitochondrial [Neolecta irregularis DAH-3]|uniref:37S ribosomal protein S4-like, mitochondrial n=1 Tax=Neolecta irregularis (strain DAH-3) TaxID=1198029 RepID=A0A1U7LGB9_NEOID|nr:37S ribosomal protein S4-like, mitochondrial [Neolecta irregularis DAH-3]|eukprot:OLL21668.1 37S ribosomal protein S4-like, mitochondrial [Neolecta irregularis DAH-3]